MIQGDRIMATKQNASLKAADVTRIEQLQWVVNGKNITVEVVKLDPPTVKVSADDKSVFFVLDDE